jgi:hypothetical protein
MTQAFSSIILGASVDAIWKAISGFGAADHYLAGAAACSVEVKASERCAP